MSFDSSNTVPPCYRLIIPIPINKQIQARVIKIDICRNTNKATVGGRLEKYNCRGRCFLILVIYFVFIWLQKWGISINNGWGRKRVDPRTKRRRKRVIKVFTKDLQTANNIDISGNVSTTTN